MIHTDFYPLLYVTTVPQNGQTLTRPPAVTGRRRRTFRTPESASNSDFLCFSRRIEDQLNHISACGAVCHGGSMLCVVSGQQRSYSPTSAAFLARRLKQIIRFLLFVNKSDGEEDTNPHQTPDCRIFADGVLLPPSVASTPPPHHSSTLSLSHTPFPTYFLLFSSLLSHLLPA